MEKMESLERLKISKNPLKKLPSTLNQIKSLKELFIDTEVKFDNQKEIVVQTVENTS